MLPANVSFAYLNPKTKKIDKWANHFLVLHSSWQVTCNILQDLTVETNVCYYPHTHYVCLHLFLLKSDFWDKLLRHEQDEEHLDGYLIDRTRFSIPTILDKKQKHDPQVNIYCSKEAKCGVWTCTTRRYKGIPLGMANEISNIVYKQAMFSITYEIKEQVQVQRGIKRPSEQQEQGPPGKKLRGFGSVFRSIQLI
jgi:hypothetical protein